jgi:DNA-binding LytR/AlgR family response regulator
MGSLQIKDLRASLDGERNTMQNDTIKIGICDDSKTDSDYISSLVKKWGKYKNPNIVTFSSAEEFLFNYEEEKDYDILLLDIEMKGMDGVTLARKLRGENDAVQIVFITGYSDYIAEGYDVDALHYLMKPVKEDKFFQVLDKAAAKLSKNEKQLRLETGSGVSLIPIYRITYIDVRANYITIHAGEEYTIKKTLSEIEKELDDRFFRISRAAIVNLGCISRVTKTDIILNDGTAIPLPRGAYDKVNRAIIAMER